ncbi:MAG: hypothetical protein ACI9TB_002397 [Parasphingorhabdus sp.]|uniref:CAP domain-containing protein n=1 Tax=Parasphingorhabdus sp. TaxID=2709688 RepID=UPI0039E22C1F
MIAPALAACSAAPPQLGYLETSFEQQESTEVAQRFAIKPTPRLTLTPPPRKIKYPKSVAASGLQGVMMQSHNQARARTGAPPLVWDSGLAKDAATYANSMARTGRFAHDNQSERSARQGENLWMGTRNAYPQTEMVGSWVDEDRYFKRGLFPENSTTGSWHDIGHYTQIIWPTTKRVGCALVNNRDYDYLVCRYSPAGNVMGQDPLRG